MMAVIDAAHPALVNPVSQKTVSDDCACCGGGGPITVKIDVPKTGYLFAESIIGSVQIVNQSKASVRTLSCRLVQTAVHRTHS